MKNTDNTFTIHNEKGFIIYNMTYDFWSEFEYDENDNLIWFRNSKGFWSIRKYDKDSKKLYHADSDGLLFVDV